MDQEPLFYDDELDALKDAVRILGGSKIVAPLLWPEKKPDIGARCLADALNANRAERLTLAQVMFVMKLARQKGYHGPWRWICGEVGYKADAVDPEDEVARLQREYIASVEAQRRLAERMEKTVAALGALRRVA